MHRTRSLIVGACAIALALTTPALTTRALAAEPTTFVFTVDNFTWTDHPATDYDPTASEIDFMKPGLERARRGAGVRS